MNTLRTHILQGEKLLKSYRTLTDKITEFTTFTTNNKFDKSDISFGISILLEIEKTKLDEKISSIESRMVGLRKQYMEEFEKDSAECNLNMDKILSQAEKYFDRDPKGISDKLSELIRRWDFAKTNIEQEEKNDIYFEIKGIIEYFKKKTK